MTHNSFSIYEDLVKPLQAFFGSESFNSRDSSFGDTSLNDVSNDLEYFKQSSDHISALYRSVIECKSSSQSS